VFTSGGIIFGAQFLHGGASIRANAGDDLTGTPMPTKARSMWAIFF
jgi:hypothetical protein